jgi:adenylate cyclase
LRHAVNGDIAGYSRLMADDAARMTSIMEDYRQIVSRRVDEGAGTLVNFAGDSFMAVFPDAMAAMQAAISITTDVEGRNVDVPEHQVARFRIGIDTGDVTTTGGRWFGEALNIASRIQELAPAGGIGVSGRVYRALDEPKLRLRPAGVHLLRGIPEPTEVYELIGLPSDEGGVSARRHRLSLETPTMVVLPIHSDSMSDAMKPVAELWREDLIHRLAGLPRLEVVDATNPQPEAAGSAHYLLETGALQFGEEVRVYAKVLHMATLNVVTSHRWSTSVAEVLSMVEQMVDDVVRGIEIELVIGEQARMYAEVADPEILPRMYEGWYHMTAETPRDWAKAVEIFESIVEERPDHVYGHSLLAFTNLLGAMGGYSDDPEATLEEAYRQAAEVVDRGTDPTGLSGMVLGATHLLRGRPEQALEIIEQVQITRPTCDLTYALEGDVRRYLGQWDRSVELLDTAMRLSALTPEWYPSVQACSMFLGGRLDSAGATAEEVIEHNPNNLEALMVLAAVQSELGLERRARATADLIRDRFPDTDIDAWLEGHPFVDHGVIERWRKDLVGIGLLGVGATS